MNKDIGCALGRESEVEKLLEREESKWKTDSSVSKYMRVSYVTQTTSTNTANMKHPEAQALWSSSSLVYLMISYAFA